MRSIYFLLTRTRSIVSRTIHFFTEAEYTHVAIAFDRELVYLYSSSRKNGKTLFPAGPCMEHLDRGLYTRVGKTPCAIYEMKVTDEAYEQAKREAEWFILHQDRFKFNILGIIACKFGIGLRRKDKFFCSQFVAEILLRSHTVNLPKRACLMRPMDYMTLPNVEKIFEGDIGELAYLKNAG